MHNFLFCLSSLGQLMLASRGHECLPSGRLERRAPQKASHKGLAMSLFFFMRLGMEFTHQHFLLYTFYP
jgi:hypothetical protein